jgi:hypothetical protein
MILMGCSVSIWTKGNFAQFLLGQREVVGCLVARLTALAEGRT